MRRGDVVLVVAPGAYGKPRPAVVVQKDILAERLDSVVVCPLTSDLDLAGQFRLEIKPAPRNGLRLRSHIMVDKVQAVPREKVRAVIGHLEPDQVAAVNRALMLVLDLP